MIILRSVAVVVGLVVVLATLLSALTTIVVPRGYGSWLTRRHFRVWRRIFDVFATPSRSFEDRDRALAHFAPVALVTLPAIWVIIVCLGFTAVFWGVGVTPLSEAFAASGSSLFTLGFVRPSGTGRVILSFVEAGIGLGLVSLMISYLPTIYSAFSRREALVGLLEVRAGLPPSPADLLTRYARIGWLDRIEEDVFEKWELWFMDVEESHTSQPALVFFRSPLPERSWVTAAGCVLDTAAIVASTLDRPHDARADVTIRSGFLALRRIADYFGIVYDADPPNDAPVSVTRDEFDELCAELRAGGIPLKADLDQAWSDFVGWRVNYDTVLIALCRLVMAPPSKWSSDRIVAEVKVPTSARRRRRT